MDAQAPDAPRTRYDDVAYPSHVHPEALPDYLLALARLHGLAIPDPESPRVLEIGCGSATQLLAIACSTPGAHLVGVDPSRAAIEIGRSRAESLAVKVDLRVGTADALAPSTDGQFDVILAHGVYGWIDQAQRDALLAAAARLLAPSGLLYLSFDVVPGSCLREAARQVFAWAATAPGNDAPGSDTQGSDTPGSDTVRRGRDTLELLSRVAPADRTIAAVWRNELALVAPASDAYLFHDHLAPVHRGFRLGEVARSAANHGLEFLAEADIADEACCGLCAEAREQLRSHAGGQPVAFAELLDFASGRTFRRSLFVHQHAVRNCDPSRAMLELSLGLCRPSEDGGRRWRARSGRAFEQLDPRLDQVLARLEQVAPGNISVVTLTEAKEPADVTWLAGVLVAAAAEGLVRPTVRPLGLATTAPQPPVAFPLARLLAAAGEHTLPTLVGTNVRVDETTRQLVAMLDGSVAVDQAALALDHNETTVAELLVGLARCGLVHATPGGSVAARSPEPAAATPELRSLARRPTKADVVAAYQLLLGRAPESAATVEQHQIHTPSVRDLINAFAGSTEFLAINPPVPVADPSDQVERLRPLLSRWRRTHHEVPAPTHWVDPLGVVTATGHLPRFEDLGGQAHEQPDTTEAIEWFALLQALDCAQTTLTVVELGAGWAPWLVRAGVAWHTHRPGQGLRLLGVEGEPTHLLMARSHARDNGLDEVVDLRAGAVGTADTTALFETSSEPAKEWGTRLAGATTIAEGLPRVAPATLIPVPCWSLADILQDLERVDFLHVDIQGSEAEVLLADPETLSTKVRRLLVGTHARSIEATLLARLPALGFQLVEEKACRYRVAAGRGSLSEDGAQYWHNPQC